MAIATLESMHKVLDYITNCSLYNDLISWNDALITLRRDVAPFIKDTEFEYIENKFKELNSQRWMYKKPKSGKIGVLPGQIDRVYLILDDLTIKIKRYMKDAGLLMPKSDDPRFALEQ